MAFCKILAWKGIPSQIKAWDDVNEVNVELPRKFIARIDQTAQAEGLTGTDDYLSHWAWSEEQERPGTAADVAQIVEAELESDFEAS